MADKFKPCAVKGCNGNSHYTARGARGWCNAHYLRNREHGDPCAGGVMHGEPMDWLSRHIQFGGDDCLIWPFSRYQSGYGQVRFRGESTKASRAMCILAHGEPGARALEAAHSCGKGHEGCVNPRHLRWATPKGNCADRAGHGTENRGTRQWCSKLTESDVREIRSTEKRALHRELAAHYGVSRMTISDVLGRRTWAWLE